MTSEKLFELHQAAKDAKINGGRVSISADDLLSLLPPAPEVVSKPVTEPAVGDNSRPLEFVDGQKA